MLHDGSCKPFKNAQVLSLPSKALQRCGIWCIPAAWAVGIGLDELAHQCFLPISIAHGSTPVLSSICERPGHALDTARNEEAVCNGRRRWRRAATHWRVYLTGELWTCQLGEHHCVECIKLHGGIHYSSTLLELWIRILL